MCWFKTSYGDGESTKLQPADKSDCITDERRKSKDVKTIQHQMEHLQVILLCKKHRILSVFEVNRAAYQCLSG